MAAQPAAAQGVRGSTISTLQYAEIRPIRRDTVDSAQVTRTPGGRFELNGVPVECAGAICTLFAPAEPQHALFFTQDVAVTAWGLGVSGLSGTLLVRARGDAGGDFQWPRYGVMTIISMRFSPTRSMRVSVTAYAQGVNAISPGSASHRSMG
jgi:hypothetical protein